MCNNQYNNPWTKQEDQILIDNYGKLSYQKMSKLINRNEKCIKTRIYNLKITNKHIKNWTEEEYKYLIENCTKLTIKEISIYLNKTKEAVQSYAQRHKIRFKKERNHRWKDLTTQQFGKLLVIKLDHVEKILPNRTICFWKCLCNCGNQKPIIVNTGSLINGNTTSCGCFNKQRIHETHYLGTKNICGEYWTRLKNSAKYRHLKFTIDINNVQQLLEKQNYKSALSGIDICGSQNCSQRKYSTYNEMTASLDRINNKIGYIENNIQWIHKIENQLKWNLSEDELFNIIKTISNYQNNKTNTILTNTSLNQITHSKNYRGTQDISGTYFCNILNGAKNRNIPFNITIQDLQNQYDKQNHQCIYTGWYLTTNIKGSGKLHTASLDRINSNKGYEINNIQFIHKPINSMKNDLSNEEFIYWCNLIYNHMRKTRE